MCIGGAHEWVYECERVGYLPMFSVCGARARRRARIGLAQSPSHWDFHPHSPKPRGSEEMCTPEVMYRCLGGGGGVRGYISG